MSRDKIDYLSKVVNGYTGYTKWREDDRKIREYVEKELFSVKSLLVKISVGIPPDASHYIDMGVSIIENILINIESDIPIKKPDEKAKKGLVDLDYRIVELTSHLKKVINTLLTGPSLALVREYSKLIYQISVNLKKYYEERIRLLAV